MAGLEVVVRPVVFPNIRPQPPQKPIPPADDPEAGFCEIKGNGARQITLTHSFSVTSSKSAGTETERRVDRARVYQKDGGGSGARAAGKEARAGGTVNKENFVDVEVATRIRSNMGNFFAVDDGSGPARARSESGTTSSVAPLTMVQYYSHPKESDNIAILERDVIKKANE